MSDDPHEHDESDECPFPMECLVHNMLRAKVRAVKVDSETYVNASDVAEWIRLTTAVDIQDIRDTFSEQYAAGMIPMAPDDFRRDIAIALLHIDQGAKGAFLRVHAMIALPIEPMASPNGLLVDPSEITRQIPDEVPTEWTRNKEQQS